MFNRSKQVLVRMGEVEAAWLQLAPEASFAGMTLEEFSQAVKPSRDERETLSSLNLLRSGAIARRTTADTTTWDTIQLVINSIKGSPQFGPDSDLYRAMGFVPRAERRSGLTRKSSVGGDQEGGVAVEAS